MLALSIYYQFEYKLDIMKVIYMLAIHELEEVEIGDLAFFETTREEKLIKGKEATDYILKDFLGKDEISALLDEYNERKTEEWFLPFCCAAAALLISGAVFFLPSAGSQAAWSWTTTPSRAALPRH